MLVRCRPMIMRATAARLISSIPKLRNLYGASASRITVTGASTFSGWTTPSLTAPRTILKTTATIPDVAQRWAANIPRSMLRHSITDRKPRATMRQSTSAVPHG